MFFINNLHKASIDPCREAHMRFNLWANTCDIGSNHIRYNRYCMWLAHIHHIYGQPLAASKIDVLQAFRSVGQEWAFLRPEFWIAHIDAYRTIRTQFRLNIT